MRRSGDSDQALRPQLLFDAKAGRFGQEKHSQKAPCELQASSDLFFEPNIMFPRGFAQLLLE